MKKALTHRRRVVALKPVAGACSALLALLAPHAYAQDAAAPAADTNKLETVVVTGIRQSLETSLTLKRENHGMVDGIVAEDIGKFPDTNLAESMQRISGVSIDRAASGEGAKVTVRGIGPDYNMVLLNGRQMPTFTISDEGGGASGSRAFDFSNLSSDSISAVVVRKTALASTPTGGIGATIDVRTARPLDTKVRIAALSVKAGWDDSNNRLPEMFKGSKVTPEVSGIYSDIFADGKFGIAISGSYSKRDSGSNKAYTQNGWHPTLGAAQNGTSIPLAPTSGADPVVNRPTGLYSTSVDMRYSLTAIQRERLNGQVTLQFAPTKDVKFTVDQTMVRNTLDKKNAENSSWFNYSFGTQAAPAPMTFTTGPVATPIVQTALFPNFDHDYALNGGLYAQKSTLNSTGFNMDWKASTALNVNLDAHHSVGKTAPNSPFGTYSVMDLAMFDQGNAIAYYDKKLPILSLPGTVYNGAKTQVTGTQFISNLSDQTVDQVQAGAGYRIDTDNKLSAGLGFTKVHNRAAGAHAQNNDWSGVGAQGDYAVVPVNTSSMSSYFSQIPGHDDPRLFPNFYTYDFNALRNQAIAIAMAKGTSSHPTPLTKAEAEAYFAAAPDYTSGSDWRTTEKSSSAYVQWDSSFEAVVPQNLSLGVRYERTTVDSSSQVVTYTASSWGSQNEINLTQGPNSFGNGTGKYSYVLPSIDWDADLTPDVKIRASFGENIGRPGWDKLLGGLSISSATASTVSGGQATTGNPNLKPLLSKNFDFSAEWYYNKSSYVSAGAFYKKVSDFVSSSSVTMTVPGLTTPIGGAYYNAGLAACGGNTQPLCIRNYIFTHYAGSPGVTVGATGASGEISGQIAGLSSDPAMPFQVTTYSNSKGDNIKGLEFNFQHMFGKSGFGVQGNYTWVRTGLKYDNVNTNTQAALLGVSNSANLVGFYEDNSWSVRAAYNWRGEFLAGTTDGAGNNPVYTEPYAQIDMSIGYKIGKQLTIQADLLNLNDGYVRQHGRAVEQLVSVTQTGRRVLIGARYRF